ncbi:IS66 family transposase [Escherichia coli]
MSATEAISSAFKVIETQHPKTTCAGATISCSTSTFKTHCTQLCRSGASGPCCGPRESADHLPLYRQSEIYRRQGVELSRATLGRSTVLLLNCWSRCMTSCASMC